MRLTSSCFVLAAAALFVSCGAPQTALSPAITFTTVPPADRGGPEVVDKVAGRVTGAKPGQQLVLFTHSFGVWWVQPGPEQPFPDQPYTPIAADSTWNSSIHLGSEYAAALVDPGYRPPTWVDAPPAVGGPVAVVAVVPGNTATRAVHPTLQFSGFEWLIRASPSDRGGQNTYDPDNAFVDDDGHLHLRIARSGSAWTSAQVILTRSLGYGTYRLTVRDVSGLDPAAVLAFYTLDDVGAAATDRNPREWDIEISRWGDPQQPKNLQYVLQPHYLAHNTQRFAVPAGPLTHTLEWQSGRVAFRTDRGAASAPAGSPVASHSATSSVPVPGNERFRMNFYDFQRGPAALAVPAEVVIENFSYEP